MVDKHTQWKYNKKSKKYTIGSTKIFLLFFMRTEPFWKYKKLRNLFDFYSKKKKVTI